MKSNFKVLLACTMGLFILWAFNNDEHILKLPELSTLPVTEITPNFERQELIRSF